MKFTKETRYNKYISYTFFLDTITLSFPALGAMAAMIDMP